MPLPRRHHSVLSMSLLALAASAGLHNVGPPKVRAADFAPPPTPDEAQRKTQHDLDRIEAARRKRERRGK